LTIVTATPRLASSDESVSTTVVPPPARPSPMTWTTREGGRSHFPIWFIFPGPSDEGKEHSRSEPSLAAYRKESAPNAQEHFARRLRNVKLPALSVDQSPRSSRTKGMQSAGVWRYRFDPADWSLPV